MSMRLRTLVLCAAALLAACADGGAVCERLRVPPASIQHVMVHVDSFNEVHEQAKSFASHWKLPSFKAVELTSQLMGAMEDMVRFQTSEAMVNLTLDHTLTYSVAFEDPLDHALEVEKEIRFTPERPVSETIEAFIAQYQLGATFSSRLEPQLRPLLVRDWGCETDETTTTKPESAAIPAPRKQAALRIQRKPSLPVLNVNGDGEMRRVTISADQELELQATVLCQELRTSLQDCLQLLDAMHNVTQSHPLFMKPVRNRTSAVSTELQLHLTSPTIEALHPTSERLYVDGEWWNMATGDIVPGRYNVCLHLDLSLRPQLCGQFPAPENNVYFIKPYSLQSGHHTVLISKQVTSSTNEDEDEDDDNDDDEKEKKEPPRQYIAARHFWIVTPTVELKKIQLKESDAGIVLDLQIQTTAVDLQDQHVRVCVVIDTVLDCFQSDQLVVEHNTGVRDQLITVFRAPVYGVGRGKHMLSVLLVNSVMKSFASTTPLDLNVAMNAGQSLTARNSAFFTEPPLWTHNKKPTHCPSVLPTAGLGWICALWRREWGRFSQNGEDGVLQSLFHHVGVTNRVYVEFGTEDGGECNTRYLREVQGWTGLLMDGRYENAEINLHKEWISPENINELFSKYDVPREFDLLSIDVDFNDYWILEAIDRTRFSPRVIVIEINSHIPPDEARVVKYQGPAAMWDQISLYFGVGVGAMHLWGQRHGYSLVYCETRGVNCFLVRDDVLASVTNEGAEALVVSDVLHAEDLFTPPNFFSRGLKYDPPTPESGVVEEWEWLDEE